jgi:uncharacterized protein
MKHVLNRFLAVFLLLAPMPALAQTQPEMAEARRLVEALNVENTIKQVMPVIVAQIGNLLATQNPAVKKDLDAIAPDMLKEMLAALGNFKEGMAKVYAERFTKDELAATADFFSSPLGQKLASKQGELHNEGVKMGQKWGEAIAPKIMDTMRTKLREKGHNI